MTSCFRLPEPWREYRCDPGIANGVARVIYWLHPSIRHQVLRPGMTSGCRCPRAPGQSTSQQRLVGRPSDGKGNGPRHRFRQRKFRPSSRHGVLDETAGRKYGIAAGPELGLLMRPKRGNLLRRDHWQMALPAFVKSCGERLEDDCEAFELCRVFPILSPRDKLR